MVNKNFACKHFGPKVCLSWKQEIQPKCCMATHMFTLVFAEKNCQVCMMTSLIILNQSQRIMHLFLKSHSPSIVGTLPPLPSPPPFLYKGGWEGLSFHNSPKRGDSSFSNKTRGIGKIRWYHLFSSLLTLDVNVSVFVLCVSFAYLHYFSLLSLCFPEMNQS